MLDGRRACQARDLRSGRLMPMPVEPLLLLPGTLCNARLWGPTLDRLRHPDARMPALRGARSTPELARLLLRQAPPRFALAGFSLGAIVALEMIAQAPGRVTRLALVAGNARADEPAGSARRHRLLDIAKRDGTRLLVDRDLWPTYVTAKSLGDWQMRALIGDMAEDGGVAALYEQAEIAIHRADSRPRLSSIAVPTLVVAGTIGQVCPPDRSTEIAAAISRCQLTMLPAVGHFVPLEAADKLAQNFSSWLQTDPPRLSWTPRGNL